MAIMNLWTTEKLITLLYKYTEFLSSAEKQSVHYCWHLLFFIAETQSNCTCQTIEFFPTHVWFSSNPYSAPLVQEVIRCTVVVANHDMSSICDNYCCNISNRSILHSASGGLWTVVWFLSFFIRFEFSFSDSLYFSLFFPTLIYAFMQLVLLMLIWPFYFNMPHMCAKRGWVAAASFLNTLIFYWK